MTDTTYYAIGDVHGEYDKLTNLLEFIGEDAKRRAAPHLIVFIGDLVDRGPDSRSVVQCALELSQQGRAICILGNHEQMLIDAFDGESFNDRAMWALNGGDAALESYERVNGRPSDWRDCIDRDHITWLRSLPTMWRDEGRRIVFVHGGIDPVRFPDCPDGVRIWTRSPGFFRTWKWPERDELKDILVVHGHTPTDDFEPDVVPRRINVDTGACFGGPLTAVVLAPGEEPRFLLARS